jgi:hypothetical protein
MTAHTKTVPYRAAPLIMLRSRSVFPPAAALANGRQLIQPLPSSQQLEAGKVRGTPGEVIGNGSPADRKEVPTPILYSGEAVAALPPEAR